MYAEKELREGLKKSMEISIRGTLPLIIKIDRLLI